jgi:hypothetical protein
MGTRLVTLAALLGSVGLLAAPSASGDASFDDPAGDQRNTEELVAPDITAVQVSNTPDGLITVRLSVANHTSLPSSSRIAALFDVDRRIETGELGFEYAVRHDVDGSGRATLTFERWDEGVFQLVQIPATNLSSSFSAGVFTLTVPRSELGNTTGFQFGMYAARLDPDGDDHAVDDAPNANLWSYELTGLPAPRLSTTGLVVMPGRPVAGKSFVVHAGVRRVDTGTPVTSASVSCTARIGGAKARAVGRFSGGRARCVVSVPRAAKGKTLRGTITIRADRAAVSRNFSYRIV